MRDRKQWAALKGDAHARAKQIWGVSEAYGELAKAKETMDEKIEHAYRPEFYSDPALKDYFKGQSDNASSPLKKG